MLSPRAWLAVVRSPAKVRRENLARITLYATVLVAGSSGITPTSAQVFELTHQSPPTPLPTPSLVAGVIEILEREAAEFTAAEPSSDAATRARLAARARLRLLASQLLARSTRPGDPVAAEAFIRGMKLAAGRAQIDAALEAAPAAEKEPSHAHVAIEAIEHFNRGFDDYLLHGDRAAEAAPEQRTEPDEDALALLLARLLPAVLDDPDAQVATHWVRGLPSPNAAPAADATSLQASIVLLRERAALAPLDDAVREELASIIEFLDRGRHFADLAPRVQEHLRQLNSTLGSVETMTAANWMTDAMTVEWKNEVAAAIRLFPDPATREQAVQRMQALAVDGLIVRAGTLLVDDNIKPADMRQTFTALTQFMAEADSPEHAQRALALGRTMLERMVEARTISDDREARPIRELRTIERDLQREYRSLEAKVLEAMMSGTIYRESMSDPAMASLLEGHRQRVEDLRRLRRLPRWSEAINRIYPPAAADFEIQMRRLAGDLIVPTKLSEARLALDRFERELQLFDGMPMESALAQGHPIVMQITGGLHAPMLERIVEARRAWADDWSRPTHTPEPARLMLLLRNLLETMQGAAALIEWQADVLNRWPAWQLSPAVIAAGQQSVQTRLQLACAAAARPGANGRIDDASLREQLDRLEGESPVSRLAGRLMAMLGNQLRERDAGAAGVLAQLVLPPDESTLLVQHRHEIAQVCRFVAEAAHAQEAGDARAAAACQQYADDLARRLLKHLAE